MNQTDDLVSLLKTTGSLADGETVSRFAATRRLSESMVQGGHSVSISAGTPALRQSGIAGGPVAAVPLGHLSPQGELQATEWNPETCGVVRLRQAVWNNPGNLFATSMHLSGVSAGPCLAFLTGIRPFHGWAQRLSALSPCALPRCALLICAAGALFFRGGLAPPPSRTVLSS